MPKHCGTHPTPKDLRQHDLLLKDAKQVMQNRMKKENLNNENLLYLSVVYLVLPFENSPLDASFIPRIRANHEFMNQVYQSRSGLTLFNSTNYPDVSRVGTNKANVQFLPESAADLSITNKNVVFFKTVDSQTIISSYEEAESYVLKEGFQFQDGVMYVIITSLGGVNPDLQLLGEAKNIPSTRLVLHHLSVGSPTMQQDNTYSMGLTLCHEMGHCLGLNHPFPTNSSGFVTSCSESNNGIVPGCSGTLVNCWHQAYYNEPSMPLQKLPNFSADTSKFTFSGTALQHGLDNRDIDDLVEKGEITLGENALFTTPLRCPTTEAAGTAPYEFFSNIMDYSEDQYRRDFTSVSKDTMRTFLLGNASLYGDVTSNVNGVDQVKNAPDFMPIDPGPGPGPSSSSSSGSSLSTAEIAGIVGGVIGFLLVVALVWYGMKQNNSENINKRSEGYDPAEQVGLMQTSHQEMFAE